MKKVTAFFLIAITLTTSAFAECDYSKIIHNENGTYTYSKELHVCVGQMKQDLETATTQLGEYKKAIELKDLAISKADQRSQLWMDTSDKLQTRLNAVADMSNKNQWLMFGLGVVTALGAGYVASQVYRH